MLFLPSSQASQVHAGTSIQAQIAGSGPQFMTTVTGVTTTVLSPTLARQRYNLGGDAWGVATEPSVVLTASLATGEEFDRSFTGIVLSMRPGPTFTTAKTTAPRMTLRSYLTRYARLAPVALVQILLASLFLQLFGLVTPVFTAVLVDTIIPFQLHSALLLLSLGLLLIILAQGITTLIRGTVLTYLQTRIDVEMMLHFCDHLLSLPLRFFQQRSTGDLLSRLSSNAIIRDAVGNQLISTVLDGSFVLVYFFILLAISPMFALLALVIGLAQATLLLTTTRQIKNLSRRELLAIGKAQGYFGEMLNSIVSLKAAGAENRARQTWSNHFYEQMNVSSRRFYVSSLIATATSTLASLAPFLLLWVGTLLVLMLSRRSGAPAMQRNPGSDE